MFAALKIDLLSLFGLFWCLDLLIKDATNTISRALLLLQCASCFFFVKGQNNA